MALSVWDSAQIVDTAQSLRARRNCGTLRRAEQLLPGCATRALDPGLVAWLRENGSPPRQRWIGRPQLAGRWQAGQIRRAEDAERR